MYCFFSIFREVHSFYKSKVDSRYYHLHKEFVTSETEASYHENNNVEHATLCHSCFESVHKGTKMPIYSLIGGIDFGNADRIFLPKLTLAEEYVISFTRLFIVIIKLAGYQHEERQAGKLGHAIAYPQYGEKLEEEIRKSREERNKKTYPQLEDLYECLSVAFVGSQLQWAALVADKQHRIFHPIDVRCDVIYMWMDALIALHSRYRNVVIDKSLGKNT